MFTKVLTSMTGAALIALGASAARAADLPVAEPAPVVAVAGFSWTGFYIGAQAGYAWGRSNNGVPADRPKGWLLGGYAGYNVQLDNSPVVFGVETDFNWSDVDDKVNVLRGLSFKQETKWEGATRARVGYAFDHFLVYGAGGVAYAKRELKVSVPGASASDSKTAVGWTAGGGVEAAVTDNIVTRVEYRYVDYGTDSFSLAGGGGKTDLREHRVLGGVAYKF